MKMVVMQVGMLGVNCYIVVSDSQNAAVIDPGGEAERILDYLQANKLTLQKILLTHGHIDHIGAVKALKERTGAEIYIHASDAEMLSDPVKNTGFSVSNGLSAGISRSYFFGWEPNLFG